MVKAIIFDYFGVICSDEFFQSVRAGSDEEAVFDDLSIHVNNGDISWSEFCSQISSKTGLSVDQVKQQYQAFQLNAGLIAAIQQIKQDYKVALLTNANSEHIRPMLAASGIDTLFDELIISSEISAIKPQPQIYKHAARQLNVDESECLFIDDSAINVEGALHVGMQSFVYQSTKQTIQKITALDAAES